MSDSPSFVQRGADTTWQGRPHRPTLVFRGLGIDGITHGRLTAQIVKASDASDTPQDWHRHNVEIQFFYLIAGEMTIAYEDGSTTYVAGDLVVHQSGLVHRVVRHTADLELLEVTGPAGYDTEVVSL